MIFHIHSFDLTVFITSSVIKHFPVSVLVTVLTEVYFSVIVLFQFPLQLIEITMA